MKFIYILILAEVLTSCHLNASDSSMDESMNHLRVNYTVSGLSTDTTLFGQPQQVGVLTNPDLVEVSGLAASHTNPGYLWAEEDSGNPNQVQLINQQGKIAARFVIDGATNRDWEDIAVGPGPIAGKSYVYVAEIGDNRHRYSEKIIYRFPEPTIAGQPLPYAGRILNVEAIRLQLPDDYRNAEAILVDSTTNDLFILSKGERSVVYRAAYPQSLTQPTTMTAELVLPFKDVTSAALSPNGCEILIRTYEEIFYYKRRADESILAALKRAPRLLPLASELQGEAVSWKRHGEGYYTTTEEMDGATQFIYYYRRKK